jgi:hypothetical protein
MVGHTTGNGGERRNPRFLEFWCLKLLEMVKKYEETPDFRICLLTYVRRNMLKKW